MTTRPTVEPAGVKLDAWAIAQYQKIQDFVIDHRLFKGSPNNLSHADIVLALADEALKSRQQLADERKEIVKLEHWLLRKDEQLAEMRGAWIPFKPGDALPPRGAYLVCTKYNTGRPRDPIGRMETSRHTDDVSAWNDYTVAYWSVPLPTPYDAALAPTSQPSRGETIARAPLHIEGVSDAQPSRGKPDELCDHCGEHANEHGACDHPFIVREPRICDAYIAGHNSSRCVLPSGHRGYCSDTPPDCAQPERQGNTCGGSQRVLIATGQNPENFDLAEVDCPGCPECAPSPPPTDDIVAFLRDLNRYIYRDQNQMLDRAIAALGEKGWQPIETAPESGWMLVSYLYHGKRCGNPEIKQRYLREFVWPSNSYEVTHWQSIPAPPVAGGK